MRIPLDYYRILGLPTQATPDQVQQAHDDRVLQQPRREYSEPAIAARRELLDEAYEVLSDAETRSKYDTRFLQQSATLPRATQLRPGEGRDAQDPPAPQTPHITIEDGQLIGALLLLQELGEYEQVLKLGAEYLAKSKSRAVGSTDLDLISADIALTVALADLELGREQWQQSHYESAAASLEAGQDLLLREGLFAGVRGEIRSDLYRLRPYRVLELLAHPLENSAQRQKGLQILRDMLQERHGIDGQGDDQSGLSVDDFLRFVQQLRDYLTVAEQHELFETEARRPSAVASYLAVYALMARGFAEHQPALVRRAKILLSSLSQRQDVHLEQSVCALMLGQTEEASRTLELSQEFEPLAYIREHSQGSPDLLPGLCLYAERWLKEEVFPNFRDLKDRGATLKDYFADPQVQTYLESLPAELPSDEWVPMSDKNVAIAPRAHGFVNEERPTAATLGSPNGYRAATATLDPPAPRDRHPRRQATTLAAGAAAGAGIATFGSSTPDPGAEATNSGGRRRRPRRRRGEGAVVPVGRSRSGGGRPGRSLKLGRLLLLIGGGLLALWLCFALLSQALAWVSTWGKDQLEDNQPAISLNEPVLSLPPSVKSVNSPDKISAAGVLTDPVAQQVLNLWLATKVEAFGKDHAVDKLENVLTGDALTWWKGEGDLSEQDGITIQYEHKLQIDGVEPGATEQQAEVLATVTEIAKYYQGDEVINVRDDRDLKMRYSLVNEEGSWKIESMATQ